MLRELLKEVFVIMEFEKRYVDEDKWEDVSIEKMLVELKNYYVIPELCANDMRENPGSTQFRTPYARYRRKMTYVQKKGR
jgi:hypothetical protein